RAKTGSALVSAPRAPTVLVMDGPGRLLRARRDRDRAGSGGKRAPNPEAQVVVPVVGGVPVADGRAEVLRIVVPGAAADHAATRGVQAFGVMAGSNRPPRKIAWRRRHVSACSA